MSRSMSTDQSTTATAAAPPVTNAVGASQWAEHTSADGRVYYYNKSTRATTWEKPDELKTPQERQTVWKEYLKDGRPYWYNPETKKSTWTRPEEIAAPATAPTAPSGGDAPRVEPDSDRPQAALNTRVDSGASDAHQPPPLEGQRAAKQSVSAERLDTMQAHAERGGSRGARARPSIPSVDAPEGQKAPRREFRTAEEAEAAFVEMLRRHKVGGDWSWEQALRAVVNDPDYRSLKTLPERKDAFHRYIVVTREIEQEQRQREQRQQREAFFALLDTLPVSEYTRLCKIEHLAADHEALRAIPAGSERARMFDAYMDEHLKELDDARRQVRRQRMREVAEFLGDLPMSAKWDDSKARLLDRFGDQLMPILRVDESRRVPMDTTYYFVRDMDSAVDPEAGLSMLDLMDAFEHAIADAEKRESEQRQANKAAAFRRERLNRDAFRKLLDEHSAQFTPSSTWSELYPQIKLDPRYTAMLGQPGSTPLELFWDCIEQLSDDYYRHRKKLEAAMHDHDFHMQPDTPLGDMRDFAAKHCDIPESYLEYIHEQLAIKARRRKEEEEERAQRHRRRLVDDLKYALYDLEPSLKPDSEWEMERPRIAALPEFKSVGDESLCRAAFDAVIERQKERAVQRASRQRSGSDARKRSRSRAAADDDTERRTRPRAEEEDAGAVAEGSDLEEGEMVD